MMNAALLRAGYDSSYRSLSEAEALSRDEPSSKASSKASSGARSWAWVWSLFLVQVLAWVFVLVWGFL